MLCGFDAQPFVQTLSQTLSPLVHTLQKRKNDDDEDSRAEPLDADGHVLSGSLKKRMHFWKKRKGGRGGGDDEAPAFIEVASVRRSGSESVAGDERSVSGASGYRPPAAGNPPIIFENEGDDFDDDSEAGYDP